MFIKEIGLEFSFLDVSLSGFGMSVMLASQNELGMLVLVLLWRSGRIQLRICQVLDCPFWGDSLLLLQFHFML
jgi:hypothetical protein